MKEILPVAEIMRRLVAETEAALRGPRTFAETARPGKTSGPVWQWPEWG
jgi:hypothetical protein